jgi:hypothetical protein
VKRELVINEAEAEDVRTIFSTYLSLGTVAKLMNHLNAAGRKTKCWTSESGTHHAGMKFSRSNLYHLLNNPTYIGRIPHKGVSYEGRHSAIISVETWSRVQDQLKEQWGERKSEKNRKSPCWLIGLLKDDQDRKFKSAQTTKAGRHYHYYYTEKESPDSGGGWRLPAREIERIVVSGITDVFRDPVNLLNVAGIEITAPNIRAAREIQDSLLALSPGSSFKTMLSEVRVTQSHVYIDISSKQLRELGGLDKLTLSDKAHPTQTITLRTQLKRRGVENRIVLDSQQPVRQRDEKLAKLVAKAYVWFEQLKSGERGSIQEIAAAERLDGGDVSRALPLAFLSPSIIEAILDGKQPPGLTPERLRRMSTLPQPWAEQRQVLGF